MHTHAMTMAAAAAQTRHDYHQQQQEEERLETMSEADIRRPSAAPTEVDSVGSVSEDETLMNQTGKDDYNTVGAIRHEPRQERQ